MTLRLMTATKRNSSPTHALNAATSAAEPRLTRPSTSTAHGVSD